MPEVGILNLQIHDDSAKAAEGLSKLVAKLGEMKNAVSGIRLTAVATGIGKLAKTVNDEIHGSTIAKLNELADALGRISSASGNVGGIRISFGGRGQNAEDMAAQLQAARDVVAQTTAGFEQIGQRVQEDSQGAETFAGAMGRVNEIVQQTGWTAQATAEQFSQMFQAMNSMRMSRSLGEGANPLALGDGTGGSGADWTQWKDGAIEVEGTVTDAMESIEVGAGDAVLKLTGVAEATFEMASSVQEMADSSEEFGNTASEFDSVTQSVQQTAEALRDYNDAIEFARKWNASGASASAYKGQEAADIEYVNNLIQSASQADLLTMRIDALRDKLYQMAGSGKYTGDQIARMVSQIQSLQAKLDGLGYTADDVKKSFSEIMVGANGLDGAFKRMFPTISGLLSRFKQLVKYRMLRAVIKQIAEGFKEGTENYYRYSQAIGGGFATKMDNAATALLQMKNSVSAALAPMIQSLIPYLQIVVNWFINLINYVNQFVSLLRGQQTWTRAVPKTTQAFDDQTKAAKKTGAAIKDLLADWDELNIIQSESGGGGVGSGKSAAEDYLNMFEEVAEFDSKIKKITDFIKNNMDDIVGLVEKAGIALLGWKFSGSFTGVLGKLSALTAAGEVIAISWKLTEMFDEQFLETHDDGWLVADALTNLVGATLAGGIVQTVLGGAAGVITAGIELTVSGGISYGIGLANEEEDEANALKDLGLIKGVIGDILLAAGFGIAAGPAGIVFGAAAGAAMFTVSAAVSVVIEQFEKAQEIAAKAFSETGKGGISVDEIFTELQTKFNEKAEAFSLSINAFSNVPTLKTDLAEAYRAIQNMTGLVKSKDSLTQDEAEKFKNAWSTVFSAFEGITADSFATVFEGLNASLSSEISEIRERSKELRIELLKVNQGMTEAQATFRVNMEDLEGKIQTGTASKDDLELYFKYLEEVSKMSGTTVTALDEVINESAKIDFGDAEHGLENMTSFIQKASEAAKTDIDTIDEGLRANLDALQTIRDEVEMYHNLGIIKDEDYNIYKGVFDEAKETIKDEAKRRKRSISDTLIETYKSILSQAMSGLDEFKGENGKVDYLAAHTYMHTYIAPILKALQDAGAEIDEEMAKMLGIGYSLQESDWLQTMWETFLSFDPESGVELPESSTFAWLKKYYGDTADLVGEVISGETVTGEMDAEILVNEPNVELSDWSISDAIYDAIWDAADAGTLSADLLFELSDKYGLDLQGVLDNMQVEYQMDDTVKQIQTIIDEINKTSGLELHLPEVKDEQSAKKTDEAARNYEDMANRIRAAFKSMDGLGFSFSVEGMNGTVGITMPAIPAAASGAVFKSGDIFSANENGQTELIGSYGNKTAVMNNDQVVSAVTNGVAQANSGIEDRLTAIENRLIAMMNKEWVARAVPDSAWSRHAQASADQYSRVTG